MWQEQTSDAAQHYVYTSIWFNRLRYTFSSHCEYFSCHWNLVLAESLIGICIDEPTSDCAFTKIIITKYLCGLEMWRYD